MEKSFNRSDRIAQELQKHISMIMQFSLKDPRITTMTTISKVEVSRDLSHAQVFLSLFDVHKKINIKKILMILNKSVGYIRKLLCQKMRLRIIPNITFYYDNTLLQGNKIALLLKKTKK